MFVRRDCLREKKIYHFLTEKATATNITITNFDATTFI